MTLPRIDGLTMKQWEITRLVAEGLKNKEIAPLVGTTELVIKNYVRMILDITGMGNRLELALWYVKRELEIEHANRSVVPAVEPVRALARAVSL